MRNKKRAINKKIFALIFLILFLFPLNNVLAAASDTCTGLVPCGCKGGPPCNLCYLIKGIQGLISYGFKIMVFVALVMIVIGGIMYITSAGNEGLMKSAKAVIFKTLAGFAIILGGWLIVNTIIYYIGASSDISGKLRLEENKNKWGDFKCVI